MKLAKKRIVVISLIIASLAIVSPTCLQFHVLPFVVAANRKGQAASARRSTIYPEFRSTSYGIVRWIKEQMPLKVYISPGLSLDGFIDERLGAPIVNVDNVAAWPKLAANVLLDPNGLSGLPVAQGYKEEHYQAAVRGINMWKPLEHAGIFSYLITDSPEDADIYVFWTHHFVNKLGLALFANDIRGLTSKEIFPYQAIMAGAKADFKPVVILLRTTVGDGSSMPFGKMQASAAHEFGHALGIDGHSKNPGDLMSSYYGNGVLSPNDIATMRYLYSLTPDKMP